MNTEPSPPPPAPPITTPAAPQEKCLVCDEPVPLKRKSFCSSGCESQYVKRTVLRPKKPLRSKKPLRRRR